MKKFLITLISVMSVFSTTVFADEYTAVDNQFEVQLNGSPINIEGYNINGSTYFKLKDLSSVLENFNVGFNDGVIQIAKDGYSYSESTTQNTSNDIKVNDVSDNSANYQVTDTKFDYYKNSIGRTEFYGIVEITNTGSKNLYLKNCKFDLEDNSGHLLQTEDTFVSNCPDVIRPGEKGYFYNGLGANLLDENVSTSNGLKLVPSFEVVEATENMTEYSVSDCSIKKETFGSMEYPVVTGRIKNSTNEDDSYLYVNVIFYDKNEKVLSVSGTSVTNLKANSTTSFEYKGMYLNENVKYSDIAKYKVIACKSYYQW